MIGAAFAGIARGDDDWRGQALDRSVHLVDAVDQAIEPQFKKIGRSAHSERATQISAGKNYGDDLRRHFGRAVWRSSMRSTYFASRSNSRFTKSPGLAVARLVCAFV